MLSRFISTPISGSQMVIIICIIIYPIYRQQMRLYKIV